MSQTRNDARSCACALRARRTLAGVAVSFCTRFLKPVESHHWGIVYLKEHIEKHPAAVLELLSGVVQVDLPQHFRPDLREILEAVAGVQQELREEPSFRRLHQIAGGG